ncbi:MAG: lysylphosphatidylglycerol synthase transmembrane domain-containing protein [Pirellulales bacterium]
MRKLLLTLLKLGISLAIIAYLVNDARSDRSFANLRDQPKDWGLFAVAWACLMGAVVLTIIRWYYLVRALELPFSLKDAFRLGFLGYMFNFVSLGNVGGDVFKAIFIAREQPRRRAEAVATIFVDRILGLYALFIVATIAVLAGGLMDTAVPQIRVIAQATLVCTALGALGFALLLIPGSTNGVVTRFLEGLPRVGHVLGRLIEAVRIYRRKLPVLVLAIVISLGVHALSTTGIYLVARGLPGNIPSLGAHFVIVPISMVVGILPLPLSGLGAFEAAIEFLYQYLPGTIVIAKGQGFVVALGYRVITVVIAMVGVFFYIGSRREVAEVLHEEAVESGE